MSADRNPLPESLSHLTALLRAAEAKGLKDAALWVDDSRRTMQQDSPEDMWARGARQFLWQLADELVGVAPWCSDMWRAKQFTSPLIVGKRGSKLMAMAIHSGQAWRHADSLQPICFEPDVWQPLPKRCEA